MSSDLQAGLADRLLRLGDLRLELARRAEQSGILALQSQEARLALESLAIELVDVRRFLLDQLALAPVADELALQARDLPFELIDPLGLDRLAIGLGGAPRLEEVHLRRPDGGHRGRLGVGQDRVVEPDLLGVSALGAQARLLRRKRPQPLLEPAHLGAGADPFEHDQRLALGDRVAVAHQDLANDPALEMLHRLPTAFGADHAGRDRGAGERRHRGPAAADGEDQDQHDQTRDDRPAQVAQQARRRRGPAVARA